MCRPRHHCQHYAQGRCFADSTPTCERCGEDVDLADPWNPPPVVVCAACACCDFCAELVERSDVGPHEGDTACSACRGAVVVPQAAGVL